MAQEFEIVIVGGDQVISSMKFLSTWLRNHAQPFRLTVQHVILNEVPEHMAQE